MPSHPRRYYSLCYKLLEPILDKHKWYAQRSSFQILTSSPFTIILAFPSSLLAFAVQTGKRIVKSHNNHSYNTTDQQGNLSFPRNNLFNDAVNYQQNNSAGDSVNYYVRNMLLKFFSSGSTSQMAHPSL
jgi:hypothetical protein